MEETGASSNFTEAQLVEIGVELFAAGTETTANTIRWAILYLAHNPDIQQKMYEEIRDTMGRGKLPALEHKSRLPFTEAVIMETQRMANLVPLSVMHRTMAATKLMGYDIPADTLVVPLLTAALSDPKTYPKPDEFNPYRFLDAEGKVKKDPRLIPFSAGKKRFATPDLGGPTHPLSFRKTRMSGRATSKNGAIPILHWFVFDIQVCLSR